MKNYTKKEKNEHGSIFYYNKKGQLHRTDGPAIEYSSGDKVWYINGRHHRIDGPAIEWSNGDKSWYLNGIYHREDGPAIECNGYKSWYIDGKILKSKEEFFYIIKYKEKYEYYI